MKAEACEFFLSLSEYRMMSYLTRTPENTVVEEMSTFHSNGSVSVTAHACHHRQRFISKEGTFKGLSESPIPLSNVKCYTNHIQTYL